jgi:hypothetical protein
MYPEAENPNTGMIIQANFDSQQFLQHVEAIRVFWQVSCLFLFIIVQF